jgi:hypothetical protein
MIFERKGFKVEVRLQLRPFVEFGLREMRRGLET